MVLDGPRLAPHERIGVVGHLGRPLDDVLAGVAVLGQRRTGLAGRQRRREVGHLGAAVVEVVLTRHLVARTGLEHPGQRVAVGCAPPVAGVQGTGGVGADELDVDRRAVAQVEPGEVVDALVDDVAEHVVQPAVGQVEVHEARARDLDRPHVGGRRHVEDLGQLRRPAHGGCDPPAWPWPGPRWRTSRRARAGPGARAGSTSGSGSTSRVARAARRASTSWSRINGHPFQAFRGPGGPAMRCGRPTAVRRAYLSTCAPRKAVRRCPVPPWRPGRRATLVRLALVAQRIEHRPPEAVAQVRVLPRALPDPPSRSGAPCAAPIWCVRPSQSWGRPAMVPVPPQPTRSPTIGTETIATDR